MDGAAKLAILGILVSVQFAWATDACEAAQEPGVCARILSNLGSLYYSQERYREAEPLFVRAIALWSRSGESSADLTTTLHNLAAVYRAESRFGEAVPLYQRALRIRESLYGANAVELVPVLNGLATAYLETRNRKQAERLFRRAETIDLQNFSEDDLRLGQDAYNAGVLALGRKHYVIAEGRFKQSAAIFIKRLPPNDPEIGNVAAGLADVYRREARFDESATLYRTAIGILEQSWGRENPRLLAVLEAYSTVLRVRQDYAEAESIDTQAMKIRVMQALRDH